MLAWVTDEEYRAAHIELDSDNIYCRTSSHRGAQILLQVDTADKHIYLKSIPPCKTVWTVSFLSSSL